VPDRIPHAHDLPSHADRPANSLDVDELKRTMAELREAEQQMSAVLDATRQIVDAASADSTAQPFRRCQPDGPEGRTMRC
jgi:hypothetical protein